MKLLYMLFKYHSPFTGNTMTTTTDSKKQNLNNNISTSKLL